MERRDQILGAMDPTLTDRTRIVPAPHGSSVVDRIRAQESRVGHGDHEMGAVLEDPVDLAEDPVEVLDEAQGSDREGDVDLVGPDEGEVGELGRVEPHHGIVTSGEMPARLELARIGVHRRDDGAAPAETDGIVPGAAAQHEDVTPSELTQQATFDVGPDPGPELDVIEWTVGSRGAGLVDRHAPSVAHPETVRAHGAGTDVTRGRYPRWE